MILAKSAIRANTRTCIRASQTTTASRTRAGIDSRGQQPIHAAAAADTARDGLAASPPGFVSMLR